jgi:hypothetical protein
VQEGVELRPDSNGIRVLRVVGAAPIFLRASSLLVVPRFIAYSSVRGIHWG